MNDPELERELEGVSIKLAACEQLLASDPASEQLQRQRFRLQNLLDCYAWLFIARAYARRGRLLLGVHERTN